MTFVDEIEIFKQYLRRTALDLLLIPLAFYLAWLIRFDLHVPVEEWQTLINHLVPITLVYISMNLTFGIYRHLWAYASFRDVILLSVTVGLATLFLLLGNVALTSAYHYRLSTGGLIIGGILTLALSTAVKYRRQLLAIFYVPWLQPPATDIERVLIVGINDTAQQLATKIYLGKSDVDYEVIGFVSNSPQNKGMNMNGIKILGTLDQISTLVAQNDIDIIIIAQRPADHATLWRLVAACRETPAQVKVLPDVLEVLKGCYEDPLTLREVSIEDILERPPLNVDTELCQYILADQVVLVTGAAGSIGSELCRQILSFKPRLLLALDNNETGLYELNLELNRHGEAPLEIIMANVGDWYRMNRIFAQYKPQVVFHAAAYKHVPLVEYHAEEAFKVNIMGTVITSEAAHQHQAERFVFISTDKAVNPTSLMGASKHIGELWIQSLAQQSCTIFSAVRFGNVIGSRGSVLPTFAKQIEQNGPVTVTDPHMYRYFMSIPEAVSLVLETAAFGQNGHIFMLEMGQEVSILKLAQRMIRLKGLRIDKDIAIKFTGMRPGEKLRENLAYHHETKALTPHPRIYSLQSTQHPIPHDRFLNVIGLMADSLQQPCGPDHVRDGIFQVAAGNIDTYLNNNAALDLKPGLHEIFNNFAAKNGNTPVM